MVSNLARKITTEEWRWVAWLILIVLFLIGAPYLFGYLMAGPNLVYTGFHALTTGDLPVYYSYINQVKEGNFLLKDLFTSEPQSYGTFNLLWFLVGLMARAFNLGAPLAFHLARLILAPVLIVILYFWLSYFLRKNPSARSVCFFIFLARASEPISSAFF